LSFTAQAATGYGLAIIGLAFTPASGFPALGMTVTLRKVDGTSLATCGFGANGSCDFAPASFANTGTYFLDFDPGGLFAASFTAVLSTDATGSIVVDADPTAVTIAREGQNARYTFSGTAGQLVSVVVTGSTIDDGNSNTVPSTQILVQAPSNGAT